ncbi:MAG: hypothetical protein JNL98_40650 [Bryobacterales bacterium]|nr:hypothetical protein [Bryobacterales bacterium]
MTAYLSMSFSIALWFAWRGVDRFDEKARGAGCGFRLLLIPGTMVFWPLLLLRRPR